MLLMKMLKKLLSILMALLIWVSAFSLAAESDAIDSLNDEDFSDLGFDLDESDLNLDEEAPTEEPSDVKTPTDETVTEPTTEDVNLAWGYSSNDSVIVKEQWEGFVILETPIINDGNGERITSYSVVYSTKSLKEADPLSAETESFTADDPKATTLEMRLEGLEPGKDYYVITTPINKDNIEGEPSEELQFTTNEVIVHDAPAETPKVNDLSCFFENNEIKCRWTPVAGIEKFEIHSKLIDDKDFTRVGEVEASKAGYSIAVFKKGDYLIKFVPMDGANQPIIGSPEEIKNVKVEIEPTKPEVKAPPVGPAENFIIAMLLLAGIAYAAFRLRAYRK